MSSESEIDSRIQKLFDILKEKKKEVDAAEQASSKRWVTNCSFPPVFGDTNRGINIQTQTQVNLIGLLSDLLVRDQSTRNAAELMGVPHDGLHGGYTVESWVEDFKTRAAKLTLATRKAELAGLEKRLDAIVSPEQRRALELEAITKSLTGE